jgi:hypothetical protein
MEVPKDLGGVFYYVWFAPKQDHRRVHGPGLRKDVLVFEKLKDATQAATVLAAFLGVKTVSEVLE